MSATAEVYPSRVPSKSSLEHLKRTIETIEITDSISDDRLEAAEESIIGADDYDEYPQAYVLAPWRNNSPNAVLTSDEVDFTLQHFSNPQTIPLYGGIGLKADVLNFQPCESYQSQDRYVVEQWDILGHMWTMSGVFDGHLGDATVEHTSRHLPIIIRKFLEKALTNDPDTTLSVSTVSEILQQSISSFDKAITSDVLALIPGGLHELDQVSDEYIQSVLNDQDREGENFQKARLCMYGTTALVTLVDPSRENLWIANLGDSEAVLASRVPSTSEWTAERLTRALNGSNPDEIKRVQREHPNERTCIKNQRVLGALAPFRTIGDAPFKLTPSFTRRILYNLQPGYSDKSQWEEFLRRNITPPYISSTAEITHRRLHNTTPSSAPNSSHSLTNTTLREQTHFLILATDGLRDLYEDFDEQHVLDTYVTSVIDNASWGSIEQTQTQMQEHNRKEQHLAMAVLKNALGGDEEDDLETVSGLLTPQLDEQWLDDVTIIVQML